MASLQRSTTPSLGSFHQSIVLEIQFLSMGDTPRTIPIDVTAGTPDR
jgi:hypothetical protein